MRKVAAELFSRSAMSLTYARELLKISLSQLSDVIGFDRTSQLAMDILVDVCERQFQYLAKQTSTLLQLTERDQATYFDLLSILFENNSQSLLPFQEYLGHFRSLPFSQDILRFPVRKRNQFYLRIPPKDSDELLQREQNPSTEYIYHWLPLFPHRERFSSLLFPIGTMSVFPEELSHSNPSIDLHVSAQTNVDDDQDQILVKYVASLRRGTFSLTDSSLLGTRTSLNDVDGNTFTHRCFMQEREDGSSRKPIRCFSF